ncbi:MAG TPA: FAD-dependent oxidoreductase, partial [Blastocatellia bacterium]|nr:FAD-dependent oxidoreductase [Blastocatellia bacterium]
MSTKVLTIDTKKKILKCQGPVNEEWVRYEKLIVCTGSKPVRLTCAGSNLKNIYHVRNEHDTAALVRKLERETGNRFQDRKLAPLKGKSGVLQSSRKLGADEALELSGMFKDDDIDNEANDHAVVLGGGYLGVELATALHGWGFSEVHIAFKGDMLYQKLPWDPRFRAKVQAEIEKRAPNLKLHPNTTVEKCSPREETSQALGSVTLSDGKMIETHTLIAAIGAVPSGKELFSKKAVTVVNNNNVAVDENLRLKSSETKDVFVCGELASPECGVEAARAMGKYAAVCAFNDRMMNPLSPPFSIQFPFRYSRLFEY